MARTIRLATSATALLFIAAAVAFVSPAAAAKIDIGTLTYWLGDASTAGSQDGTGTGSSGAHFNLPGGCGVDKDGNVYILDTDNAVIRKVAAGTSTTHIVAGRDGEPADEAGTGTDAQFKSVVAMAFQPSGTIAYLLDSSAHRVLKFTVASALVETFAGDGTPGTQEGIGELARLNSPSAAVVSRDGASLFVTERDAQRVRKFSLNNGQSSNFAGTAGAAGDATGTGAAARFNGPLGIARNGASMLYVADSNNRKIRTLTMSNAAMATLTGTGEAGSRDGSKANAQFVLPRHMVVGHRGDYLYVADGNVVRRVDVVSGYVDTVAGDGTIGWSSNANTIKGKLQATVGLCIRASSSESTMYITGAHSVSYVQEHYTITKTLPATPPSPNEPPTPTSAPPAAAVTGSISISGSAWATVLDNDATQVSLKNALVADFALLLGLDASAIHIDNVERNNDGELVVDFHITDESGAIDREAVANKIQTQADTAEFLDATLLVYRTAAPTGSIVVTGVSADAQVDVEPTSTPAPKKNLGAASPVYFYSAMISSLLLALVPAVM
jgi:sugar lactone lactonase YvrE